MKRPCILITTGDPRGIGPEITKKALKDSRIRSLADFSVIKTSDNTGFKAIEKAVSILKKGHACGVVTAPVSKAAINRSGVRFEGHTEFFASATRAKKIAMMFYSPLLKVTIVTRHVPLKEVPRLLTRRKIEDSVALTHAALKKYFNLPRPRIGVCGLNPHSGEHGLIGQEERKVIDPAIKKLKTKISGLQGPLPADVAFYMAFNKKLDAVVAMYHDQGLGPFKMIAFESGVNMTLGLPFVRTSPDHGTAYDIAGKNKANPESMKQAIKLAVSMCKDPRC